METLEPLLAKHPFFDGLDPQYLRLMVGCASNVRFADGQFVFHEQGEANQFFLIREGRVALEVPASARANLTIETLQAGEVLGWSWLVPPHRWHFSARAVGPVRALALDGRCLRQKCDEDHDLGYELLRRFSQIMAQRLQSTRRQLLDVYHAWHQTVECAA